MADPTQTTDTIDALRAQFRARLAAASGEREVKAVGDVFLGRIDRFLGLAVQLALGLIEALRAGKKLLPLGASNCSSFDSRHGSDP